MVTNKRDAASAGAILPVTSVTCSALPVLSAGGGASDGQTKARSIRSCGPVWRCTFLRIAAGGTSKMVPAIVTGIAGALNGTGAPDQVGLKTRATKIPAATINKPMQATG